MSIDRLYAEEILTEASKLITKTRKEEHGDSFTMTAKMWSDYLGIEISEADFCIMMALMKITRQKLGLKIKDHFLDAAAYVALAGSEYKTLPLAKEPPKNNPSMKLPIEHHPEGYIP